MKWLPYNNFHVQDFVCPNRMFGVYMVDDTNIHKIFSVCLNISNEWHFQTIAFKETSIKAACFESKCN